MLGIFGGTFDPIHYGHLRTVTETARALDLEQVVIVPCGIPPHRPAPCASATDRLHMVRLAVTDDPLFTVDDREVLSNDPCYTVPTLAALRRQHDGRSLCLIIGHDAFLTITSWHQWPHLFDLSHIVVMSRPGAGGDEDPEVWRHGRPCRTVAELRAYAQGGVFRQIVDPQWISASGVRAALSGGQPVNHLISDQVERYIHERRLYV